MGEAVGLDLGAATAVAARLHGDEVETAVLVPTADLGVGATSARRRLESLAARAVGGGTLPAVGVAIPALDRESEAEIEAAAREAFADPLLVLRPAAAAAWFRRTYEVDPDALLVMVEADEAQVAVTLVRPRPRIPAIERATVGEALSSGAPVLDAIDTVAAALTAARVIPTAIDVAVIVGGAPWLDGLAEGITAATDLAAVVDPEPRAAVAYGAALLASESDGFGVGAAVALGAPVVGAGAGLAATAAMPAAAPPVGAGLGEAAGALGGTGTGTGLGAAMRTMGQGKDAPIHPLGADVGDAVGGYKEPPGPHPGEGSPKRPPSHPAAGGLKRSLVLAAPAVVAVLVVGALGVRSCTQNPDTTTLATSSAPADPDDPSTTGTTTTGNGAGPGGSDKSAPLDPASSEPTSTTRPTTTTRRTPTTPGTPITPGTPAAPPTNPTPPPDTTPPSITGFGRSPSDIYADNGECNFPMTTVLSATITDDSGVAGATVRWSSSRSQGGPLTMRSDGNNGWSATLGPLADGQLIFTTDTLLITWRVTAFDAAGNSTGEIDAGRTMAVNLHGCTSVPTIN